MAGVELSVFESLADAVREACGTTENHAFILSDHVREWLNGILAGPCKIGTISGIDVYSDSSLPEGDVLLINKLDNDMSQWQKI